MKLKIKILCMLFPVLIAGVPAFPETKSENTNPTESGVFEVEPVFESSVYIHESGKKSAKNIMLVHGIGENASKIWKDIIPVLEKDFHVVYFDLPGFGLSEKKNALYSPENYSLFIKWVHDKYMDGPMYLVGHSMGASIALYYAATYPDTITRLVLIDAAGILHKIALAQNLAKAAMEEKYGRYPILKNKFNDIIQSAIEGTEDMMPKDISDILQNTYLRRLLWNSPAKIAAAALINTDFSIKIYSIKSPLWIIWGENDQIAPLRTGKMLASDIPGARLNIIPGSGHSPMIDNPSEFKMIFSKSLNEKPENPEKKTTKDLNKKNIDLTQRKDFVLPEGNYGTVNITDCKNIKITNSRIDALNIKNSDVEIENCTIASDTTGILVSVSSVIITGGSVYGNRAIVSTESRIDLAGVSIEGREAALQSTGNKPTTIIFSVCRIKSPKSDSYMHDMIEMKGENSL